MALGVRLRSVTIPRPDTRTLLGIGLAAVAALLVLWMTRPIPTVPVLVAGSDLPAGTPLSELDLTVRNTADADGLVVGDEPGELSDWVLVAPIASGEPILPSLLRAPEVQEAPDLLALELDSAHAVLGRINPGDRIDIYSSTSRPGEPTETRLVASSVFVVDATVSDSTVNGDQIQLLLAVDHGLAATLTAAMNEGDLDLVRVGE
ncbi:MAG: RcpC/CpaB family pilus assembly protein [Actinomycetota bacterium]|nr:RcpC/CpaB family pilus assembly protein [Actinomycetota bacterium]